MSQHDCGAIPVVDDEQSRHLCGMITDRDIAVRGVARGRGSETKVADLMTNDVECCPADADIKEVERVMTSRQVRRVPIIDADGELVGIVSQADLATSVDVDGEEVGLKNVTLAQTVHYLHQIDIAPQALSVKSLRVRTRAEQPDLLDVSFTVSSFEPI